MRNMQSVVLVLFLAGTATAQTTVPVPKRIVKTPRLNVIQVTAAPELIVADLDANGIDLSGVVRTSLLTGAPVQTRWVKPRSADAFVVVDATKLRQSGWSLMTAAGVALDGWTVPRGGLKVTNPAGTSALISDSFDFLAKLDGNGDGKINQSDPAWQAISFFRDADADGAIGAGELTGAQAVLQSLTVAASGAAETDALGTRRVRGSGHRHDGTAIEIAHAKPALVD